MPKRSLRCRLIPKLNVDLCRDVSSQSEQASSHVKGRGRVENGGVRGESYKGGEGRSGVRGREEERQGWWCEGKRVENGVSERKRVEVV